MSASSSSCSTTSAFCGSVAAIAAIIGRVPRATVCLPTYNERENVEPMVAALLERLGPDDRVLVIDDNSPDGTGEIADRLAAEQPASPSSTAPRRKGSAPRTSPGSGARSATARSWCWRWTATSPTTRTTCRG